MDQSRLYDVIVIGAGHAGIEAAHAAARLGARTAVHVHGLAHIGRHAQLAVAAVGDALGHLGGVHLLQLMQNGFPAARQAEVCQIDADGSR